MCSASSWFPMEMCAFESCLVNSGSQKSNKVMAVIFCTAYSCLLTRPVLEPKKGKISTAMSPVVSGWSTWLKAHIVLRVCKQQNLLWVNTEERTKLGTLVFLCLRTSWKLVGLS